jgi:hypothetical protein
LILTTSDATTYIVFALDGVVAQLVERLNGIQEVRGSNPLGSTSPLKNLHFDLISIWNASSVAVFSLFQPVPPQEPPR